MISISLEKSPLRRNDIIRNVVKNISAVPKSPIRARHPRQNTENIMNTVRFFFCCSSSSVADPTKIKTIFTSSEGCIVNPAMWTQLAEPFLVCPKIRLMSSSSTAMPISILTSFLALLRSRSSQHIPKNRMTPAATQNACLKALSGNLVDVTAILSVDRKNAIISISKPTRLNILMTMT